MINKTYEELLDLQNRAKNGDRDAQLEFGLIFYSEKLNNEKALYWISKSAAQGNTDAIVGLGLFYEKGQCGVKQNYFKASQYYIEAAKKGDKDAKILLGDLVILGKVKGPEFNNIFSYYETIYSENDSNDIYILGLCYERGIGVKSDWVQAIKLYVKAYEFKNRGAMMHLADFVRENYYWYYVNEIAETWTIRPIWNASYPISGP